MTGLVQLSATSVRFYSRHDEEVFFSWLKKLDSFVECRGRLNVICLILQEDKVSDGDLEELIALFTRYCVDLSQLKIFDLPRFTKWFKDPEKFWYYQIFN
jgi:hypothetical protein